MSIAPRCLVQPMRKHSGSAGLILLTTLLTLLALVWMGYDLRLLPLALIGRLGDTYTNSWTLHQAIDNLLHSPTDLGRAPIFYGEPVPFAYTIAPYGMALAVLPLYLLSGGNIILVFNLYLIATFPLTAWSAYLLARYLVRASWPVAALIGVMVAFAPARFLHLAQIEILSTFWHLLALYCLHRLLDRPGPRWAATLAIVFWFLLLTSGYLAYMLMIAGVILLVMVALSHRQALMPRFALYFLAACIAGIALCWPFIAFRFENPAFLAGHSYKVIAGFSAAPQDWLVGYSQLYIATKAHIYRFMALFVGITPIVLSLLGLWYGVRRGADDRPGDEPCLPSRTILLAYGLITLTGYLFTLGPELRLGDVVLPMPYRLLLLLPTFSGIRILPRFIFLAVTGMAVLSAYALTQLSERLRRRTFQLALALVTIGVVVEFTPYNGLEAEYPNRPGGLRGRRLQPVVRSRDVPVYNWLREQPPGTAIVHYPFVSAYYMADLRLHNQPMFNGIASLLPEWYQNCLTQDLTDAYVLRQLRERGIRYILVHYDLMFPQWESLFNRRFLGYQSVWGAFPLVGIFDGVAVYEVKGEPLHSLDFDFNLPAAGTGWYAPTRDYSGATHQWTNAETATIELYLLSENDLRIAFRILRGMRPELVDSLSLSVNGRPIPLTMRRDEAGAYVFEGMIPASILGDWPDITQLAFHTGGVAPPAILEVDADTPRFGLLFDWLSIQPIAGGG